jgi:hypothetical protein
MLRKEIGRRWNDVSGNRNKRVDRRHGRAGRRLTRKTHFDTAALRDAAGLRVSAVVRVVLGVALFLAAPPSKAPDLIRLFGVISVAAGLMIPCLGLARNGMLVDWWSARPAFVFRAWAMVALAPEGAE